jgi:cytidylate kinase
MRIHRKDLPPVIALDGVSGVGKSTTRKIIAKELGWNGLDSGALYRVVTHLALELGVNANDERNHEVLALGISGIKMVGDRILLAHEDISSKLRTRSIDENVPRVASFQKVRSALREVQLAMRTHPGLVADGRDMCEIFSDTPHKFFLTASLEIQAHRRYKQLIEKGDKVVYERVLEGIRRRDFADQNRAVSPLKQLPGATLIDTSHMSAEEVAHMIIRLYEQKINHPKHN